MSEVGQLISREAAGLVPPRSVSRNISPRRTFRHYGGDPLGAYTRDRALGIWRSWQRFHMSPGWAGTRNGASDIAYTIGVERFGRLLLGRWVDARTAANGTNEANGDGYAVCAMIGAGEQPTDEMLAGILIAERVLSEHHGRPLGLADHSDVRQTACPGDPLRDWRRRGSPAPAQYAALVAGRAEPPDEPRRADAVDAASDPLTGGTWLLERDGGVFTYRGATFYGSVPGLGLTIATARRIVAVPGGGGYWILGADGGVFTFGPRAGWFGSYPALPAHDRQGRRDFLAIEPLPDGSGYELVADDGARYLFTRPRSVVA